MTREAKREIATAASWLAGWAALTGFAVVLFGWLSVWLSSGLLLIGLGGLRPLALVLWHGLNFLPRGDE